MLAALHVAVVQAATHRATLALDVVLKCHACALLRTFFFDLARCPFCERHATIRTQGNRCAVCTRVAKLVKTFSLLLTNGRVGIRPATECNFERLAKNRFQRFAADRANAEEWRLDQYYLGLFLNSFFWCATSR